MLVKNIFQDRDTKSQIRGPVLRQNTAVKRSMYPRKSEITGTINRYENQCEQKSQKMPDQTSVQQKEKTFPSLSLTTTSSEKNKIHPGDKEKYPDFTSEPTPS